MCTLFFFMLLLLHFLLLLKATPSCYGKTAPPNKPSTHRAFSLLTLHAPNLRSLPHHLSSLNLQMSCRTDEDHNKYLILKSFYTIKSLFTPTSSSRSRRGWGSHRPGRGSPSGTQPSSMPAPGQSRPLPGTTKLPVQGESRGKPPGNSKSRIN